MKFASPFQIDLEKSACTNVKGKCCVSSVLILVYTYWPLSPPQKRSIIVINVRSLPMLPGVILALVDTRTVSLDVLS
jgi:hypothetical protein